MRVEQASFTQVLEPMGIKASKCILLVALLLTSALPSIASSMSRFQEGDCFTYDLYWSHIRVGRAELSFNYESLEQGQPELLHAVFTIRTRGIADRIFKVRDRIESWIDPLTGRPIFYKKKQREGKTKRDIEVCFNWDSMTAIYTRNGKVNDPITITKDTFDPLSLITEITRASFVEFETRSQATTDGKKLVYIDATRKSDKRLKIKAGKFDAQQIEVATNELQGVFEKSPDASIELWLSQHKPAIPLKMRSEVSVGSFYGELREAIYQGKRIGP
jgi:hypothetical protein